MTDLDLSFPFDDDDTLEDGWRAMARHWLTSGPIRLELNSFLVTTASGRNVTLSSGRCWVNGHFGELTSDAVVPIAVNGTGNARIDRIVLRANFTANKIEYAVLQGTPAGSPAAPSVTQNTSIWEIPLAQIAVAAGFSSLGAGTITDERRWASGKPPGGPFLIAAAAVASTNQAIGDSAWTLVNFNDSEEYDTASIHNNVTNPSRFVVPGGCGGLWVAHCVVSWEYNSTHNRGLRIEKNGSAVRTVHLSLASDNSIPAAISGQYEMFLSPGDYIEWRVWQDTGSAKNVTLARASFRYLGSLDA